MEIDTILPPGSTSFPPGSTFPCQQCTLFACFILFSACVCCAVHHLCFGFGMPARNMLQRSCRAGSSNRSVRGGNNYVRKKSNSCFIVSPNRIHMCFSTKNDFKFKLIVFFCIKNAFSSFVVSFPIDLCWLYRAFMSIKSKGQCQCRPEKREENNQLENTLALKILYHSFNILRRIYIFLFAPFSIKHNHK